MDNSTFKREHVSFSISIDAPADKIFQLACPVEELKWIDGWAYDMVYSDSGKNENNCVFTETMSARHIMGTEHSEPTHWMTTLYDPQNHVIHFVLVRSTTVTKLEITMKKTDSQKTWITWDMNITAVDSEAHSSFNDSMKDRMKLMMEFLGHSLKHYCETGKILVFNDNR